MSDTGSADVGNIGNVRDVGNVGQPSGQALSDGQITVPMAGCSVLPADDLGQDEVDELPDGAALPAGRFPVLNVSTFPRRYWDPSLYALVILAEFTDDKTWKTEIKGQIVDRRPGDMMALRDEVAGLLKLARLARAERIAEITAQARLGFTPTYWQDLLMMTPGSHPATYDLLQVGVVVGQLVAMHFKDEYSRPRPAQVFPALMPPVLTPPHPSFPNAHAVQSYLMSLLVAEACPAMKAPLLALAKRVAHNREIAGFHFHSDTVAGRSIAFATLPILKRGPKFGAMLREATAEWDGTKQEINAQKALRVSAPGATINPTQPTETVTPPPPPANPASPT